MLYQLSYSRSRRTGWPPAGESPRLFEAVTPYCRRESARIAAYPKAERIAIMTPSSDAWPALPLDAWRPTCDTLHLYTQIPGKIRLALSPVEPEWNHVPLYVTSCGLTTGTMPYHERTFEIGVDFIMHKLVISASDGQTKFIDLEPARSVASFYAEVIKGLKECGITVNI